MAINGMRCGDAAVYVCGICDVVCPDPYASVGRNIPGALFFVMETHGNRTVQAYGSINCSENKRVVFDDTPVGNIETLANRCVSSLRDDTAMK
jgi:hypothetical protein